MMHKIAASNRRTVFTINRRTTTLMIIVLAMTILASITIVGSIMNVDAYGSNFMEKNQGPSIKHLFGTDYLGRDMLARTIKGLSTSIFIGLIAASVSAVMAAVLGMAAGTLGRHGDRIISMAVNLMMGIPHIILLMLISFVCGKGVKGVIIGVAFTHWPNLTRVIRSEVIQIRSSQYVKASIKMGKNGWWIARKHLIPHLLSQFVVGLVLLFPHAILHEAAITFLGFGLPLQMPAIGVILSESMKYLSMGMWWLAFFPGLSLLVIVLLFDTIGDYLRLLMDPYSAHE
ncbi:peptide/nickel transport system permease protein [Anaerosolibacter carboniphilus]|uniref:Peptide/nickel transport system permease protein n=1 Tax=Anaerosolibacter carboniphilus TaxID=1417629 RepID=A0A841KQV5_9FIRM|nr:ABC transporter permease [Anaerosolibacter carboniphilus]MBB6216124.1 peptide/nickel transport system permease protein [Anaerosolibacter carboniphilus]